MTGIETLALETAVRGLASLIVKTTWKGGSTLFGKAGAKIDGQHKQFIFEISRQYIQNYAKRHCSLKVLGMREAVSLDDIYTTVRLLDKGTARSFESLEAMEERYRQQRQDNQWRRFRVGGPEQRTGIDVANKKQYLMVLGAPGAGKSTFLRKVGLEALKTKHGSYQHACIPVFLELKQFAGDTIDIEALIAEEFRTCGFPKPEEFTQTALTTGRLLVLFDGLDEVPSQQLNSVIEAIRNFVDRHHKNRFIASCRIAAYQYHSDFRRFTDVVVAEFDDEQIQQFINNWFRSEVDRQAQTAKKCWDLLNQQDNASAKELAQTPLLLTFLCLVYDRSQNLPDNRSTLYGKALDILLEEWAAEKRIERDPIYQGFHADLEKVLLSEIAYQGFENDQLFFSEQDLTTQITAFLADTLDAPKSLNSKAVLNAIEVQQGILVERAEGVYSFSHLTLQEYLAALHITTHTMTEELVRHHLIEDRWQEVFILVAGLMGGGAYQFLKHMEQQGRTLLVAQRLRTLIQWADWVTEGSRKEASPAAQRSLAIYFARAHAIAFARVRAQVAQDLSIVSVVLARDLAIALNLARNLNFAHNLSHNLPHDTSLISSSTHNRALDFDLDLALARARTLNENHAFKANILKQFIARTEALKAKIPSQDAPSSDFEVFVNKVWRTWCEVLKLDPDLYNLTTDEIQSLVRYLEAHQLIIRCRKAAVRVSRTRWEVIESRMLTLREETETEGNGIR